MGLQREEKKLRAFPNLMMNFNLLYIYIINKPTCYIISLENNFFMIKSSH